MSDQKLVINLSKSQTERFEDQSYILQKDALARLKDLIQSQLDTSKKPYANIKETDLSYERTHNAILIQGGRGSGKTTFLLNALHRLNKASDSEFGDISSDLYVLPMIDPTLIETKENIIIVILSMIEAAIEKLPDNSGQMEKARQALAEGLGLLDGIGSSSAYGSEWEDASWVMSRGLQKAKKGRLFELKFGVYLETALDMLDKEAFVLAFDDVDTNFSHGHTILETIRKYLTSSRLVLMLSGDLDLYGRLLRRNIYGTFGTDVLKHDPNIIGDDKHNVGHAVLELEEQYLLKVVPPQNRIPMLPLGGVMLGPKVYVVTSDGIEKELAPWARELIRTLLLENGDGPPHSFFDFISMEHLRLVIGYLRALDQDDQKTKRQMVLKVFETRLRASSVPTDLIERGNFDYALKSAFEWMGKQEDAPELIQFGVPVDPVRAVVLHCLALALSQNLEAGHGETIKALFALVLPVTMMRRAENVDKETRTSMFRFLWTQSSPSLPELAARIGSIDRSREKIGKVPASSFGSVGLTNKLLWKNNLQRIYGLSNVEDMLDKLTVAGLLAELNKKSNRDVATRNWITKVSAANAGDLQARTNVGWFSIDDLLLEERCEEFSDVLRLIVYKRSSARGEAFRSLSALSLFAVIGNLLMSEKIGDMTSYSVAATVPAFKRDKTQDDLYSLADVDDDEQSEDESKSSEDASSVEIDGEFDSFMQNLRDWHTFACAETQKAAVSPSMLGSIALRIHDDLMDLDEKVTSSWKSGEILHRQITNILHGVLVLTSDPSGRKESPKISDRPFREALKRTWEAKKDSSLHPLAVILLTCPLVWVFLNPREEHNRRGSSTGNLRDAAIEALKKLNKNRESENVTFDSFPNFESWLTPPKIRVKIGPIVQSANQRSVLLDGFYDVLNVVPRNVTK